MDTLETQLWDYIDGVLAPQDAENLYQRILMEPKTGKLYQELMALSLQLQGIKADEPSMSFSRNVMDKIGTELPPIALTTHIDKRIIFSVAALFIISLTIVFIYTLANTSFQTTMNIPSLEIIKFGNLSSGLALKAFLFIDVLLALFCIDAVLRQNLNATKKRSTN